MKELEPKGKSAGFRFEMANALWAQQGLSVIGDFQRLIQRDYRGTVKNVDFEHAPQAARESINRWVAEITRDKIKELLRSEDITPSTRLMLTNAAYFKAGWSHHFDPKDTKVEDFQIAQGKAVKASMMHLTDGQFNYQKNDEFQLLQLPYQNTHVSLLVIVPEKRGQLAALESRLTPAKLEAALSALSRYKVDLALPRFRFEFRSALVHHLKTMGLSLPFSSGAEFSGISPAAFLISAVIHQATIHVDEEGTEAAAATAVRFNESRLPRLVFRAEEPFLFLLHDADTGAVLFFGRAANPKW